MHFHQEEKMRMLVKVFRKHALYWKDSRKLLAAEEGRYLSNYFFCKVPIVAACDFGEYV